MGIDVHALKFLQFSKNKKAFKNTVTIGRQELLLTESNVRKIIRTEQDYKIQNYCEDLLIKYMSATSVESIDSNDYESSTHIADMNEPLPQNLFGKYDTVIDGGTLEHIFNVPQAFKNCSLLNS